MRLLVATRNRDKLKEIIPLFGAPELEIVCAADLPDFPEVEEDGDTLEANAIKKAVCCAKAALCWTLADDTGLEVDALDGAPGVYSARYAGEEATYDDNYRKLLHELGNTENRAACFRTVVALSSPSGVAQTVDGVCHGTITREPRGELGFGYDPIFSADGDTRTFAELGLEEKNVVSHRGKALRSAWNAWGEMLKQEPADWPS